MLDTEPCAAVIDGKAIASKMRAEIATDAAGLAEKGWQPHLVSISVGDTAAAKLYVRNQQRSAESAGVSFEARNYPADISMEQLVGVLQGLNGDQRVNGIIIQRPLPEHISVKSRQKAVHPLKDVEGIHPASIGNIVYNDLALGPCTAVAAVEILKTLPLTIEGLNVTMIGHSEIVGKPIAVLMMGLGATVTVTHHMTRSVAMHSRAADADFASCADVAGWITPVPGGVGSVTVAILMKNAVLATAMQMAHYQTSFTQTEV